MQQVRKLIGSSYCHTFLLQRPPKHALQPLLHRPCMIQRQMNTAMFFNRTTPFGQQSMSTVLMKNKIHLYGKQLFHEDRKTKDLTVWGSIKHLRHTPLPALVLGISGLIPFVAAPTYMICSSLFMADICFAQMAYGATILSFLGGVRWGYSVVEESVLRPDWINLGASVIPSLVAWTGLMIPYPGSLLTIMIGLAGAGYYDLTTYGYPPWFKGLRFILTFVAVLSLWTSFMCKYMLNDKNSKTAQNVNSSTSTEQD